MSRRKTEEDRICDALCGSPDVVLSDGMMFPLQDRATVFRGLRPPLSQIRADELLPPSADYTGPAGTGDYYIAVLYDGETREPYGGFVSQIRFSIFVAVDRPDVTNVKRDDMFLLVDHVIETFRKELPEYSVVASGEGLTAVNNFGVQISVFRDFHLDD